MKTALLMVSLAVHGAQALGQGVGGAAAPLRLVPVGDTVLVYVFDVPVAGGFIVSRRTVTAGATPAAFERRTPTPVLQASDPAALAGRLGADLPMALRAVRAVDPDELLRRLRGDRFASAVLSMVSRPAAAALGRLYADGGVQRGGDYEYRITLSDAAGKDVGPSLTGRVHVADLVPVVPSAIKATSASRQVRVTWAYPTYQGAPTDVTMGFHVYRSEGGGALHRITAAPVLRNDAGGGQFSYVDHDVIVGTYTYRISAVDLAGRESGLTAPATVRMTDHTPPATPVDLAVRNGDGVVDVAWRMSPEADAAGYHIERSPSLTHAYTRLDRAVIPTRRPIWTDTVPGGHQFFYRVIAVDSAGNASAPSNPVSASPRDATAPPPPTGLVLTTTNHRITARWASVAAPDLRGYYVYEVTGKQRTRITGRPLAVPQFVDSGPVGRGLTPGATYTIRVTALDSTFNESSPVEGRILVPDDQAPDPPSAFAARNVEGRFIEVSWSGSGSPDVRAYVLTRSGGPSDTGARAVHRFAATDRDWRDTAVVHGRRYAYRLTAVDSAGNVSALRADSVLFRDQLPPPAPRAAGARTVPRGVEIRWERVVSAELVGYNVYRSNLPTGVYRRLTAVPVSALTFTDSTGRGGAGGGGGVYYTVRAVDRSGNESAPSPVAPAVAR